MIVEHGPPPKPGTTTLQYFGDDGVEAPTSIGGALPKKVIWLGLGFLIGRLLWR